MANTHHAHVIKSLKELKRHMSRRFNMSTGLITYDELTDREVRKANKSWKKHIEKNGNVPMILKCSVCSGEEHKDDIKHGRYKPGRKTKGERDEEKGKE